MEPKPNRFAWKLILMNFGRKFPISSSLHIAFDYAAIALAVFLDYQIRCEIVLSSSIHAPMPMMEFLYIYGIVPCIFVFFIARANLYATRILLWQCIGKLFRICFCVNVLLIMIDCFLTPAESGPEFFLPLFSMLSFINLCIVRCLANFIKH